MPAIFFSSGAHRIERIRSAIAKSACVILGGNGLAVGVAGPGGCFPSTKMIESSFVTPCTSVFRGKLGVQRSNPSRIVALLCSSEVSKRSYRLNVEYLRRSERSALWL